MSSIPAYPICIGRHLSLGQVKTASVIKNIFSIISTSKPSRYKKYKAGQSIDMRNSRDANKLGTMATPALTEKRCAGRKKA